MSRSFLKDAVPPGNVFFLKKGGFPNFPMLVWVLLIIFFWAVVPGRPNVRGRAVRVFYEIPLVGRLHVSTVWALAGLATFLCLWMVGGISYEFYRAELSPSAQTRTALVGNFPPQPGPPAQPAARPDNPSTGWHPPPAPPSDLSASA